MKELEVRIDDGVFLDMTEFYKFSTIMWTAFILATK